MQKIYLISGLGADERVFEQLSLPKCYGCTYIQWLRPYTEETLAQYVNRLKVQISSAEEYILIGVSFGGVVAIELATLLEPVKTIIISSIAHPAEMPLFYRVAGKASLHKALPASLLKQVNFLTYYFFGVQSKADKQLLKAIIEDTDVQFMQWAIHQILHWKPGKSTSDLVRIHGTADKILPLKTLDNVITLAGGGHLMVVTHAREISEILHKLLVPAEEAC